MDGLFRYAVGSLVYAIIVLTVCCLFGMWARKIAINKHRSGTGFFWLGFLFPILGVIIAACVSEDRGSYQPQANGYQPQVSSEPVQLFAFYHPIRPEVTQMNGFTAAKCANCGFTCSVHTARLAKRCSNCNTEYLFDSTFEASLTAFEIPLDAPAPPAKSIEWTCSKCHASNPEKALFCMKCGNEGPSEWACTSCSTHNPSKARFCMTCGAEHSA